MARRQNGRRVDLHTEELQLEWLYRRAGQSGFALYPTRPGIGHQAAVIEGDLDAVGVVAWQHLLGAPFPRLVSCFKTIIPDSEEHLFALSDGLLHPLVRWIGV